MAGDRVIEAYLSELESELTLPRRLRRRALAEAADHLACAAADREEAARKEARRCAGALAVAVLGYGALFTLSTQFSSVRAASPFAGDPFDALALLTAQLAFVCAGLTVARALRHRRDTAVAAGKLRFLNRGAAVALAAVGAGVAADLVAAVTVTPPDPSAWRTVLVAATAAVAVATAVAALRLLRSHVGTRAQAALVDEAAPPGEDAVDDLLALAEPVLARARTLPPVAVAADRAQPLASTASPAPLDLRTHPRRFCLALAFAAGGFLAAAQGFDERVYANGVLVTAAVGGIIAGFEITAIVVCFALLGRFLGIRRPAAR